MSGHENNLTACATPRDLALGARDMSQPAAVAAVPGVHLVDLTDWICPAQVCPSVVGGVLVLRDRGHLTATYSRSLTKPLSGALAGLLK